MSKISITEKESLEIGTRMATEAVSNIRTVASLSIDAAKFTLQFILTSLIFDFPFPFCFYFLEQEKYMIERFVTDMMKVQSIVRKKIMWRGIVNSTAQSFSSLFYAFTLYFGSFLVFSGEIHFKNLLK